MKELIDEAKNNGGTDVVQDGFKIPVVAGRTENFVAELGYGVSIVEIISTVAAKHGCSVEEFVLIREGEDEPLPPDMRIDADYPHRRRHHVHYASKVRVTVYYQGNGQEHEFKRNATVRNVLVWAIKQYNIDAALATELELSIQGEGKELPEDMHIGHLAGRHHELALDMIRGHISNG